MAGRCFPSILLVDQRRQLRLLEVQTPPFHDTVLDIKVERLSAVIQALYFLISVFDAKFRFASNVEPASKSLSLKFDQHCSIRNPEQVRYLQASMSAAELRDEKSKVPKYKWMVCHAHNDVRLPRSDGTLNLTLRMMSVTVVVDACYAGTWHHLPPDRRVHIHTQCMLA